jgi:hypothetical protein
MFSWAFAKSVRSINAKRGKFEMVDESEETKKVIKFTEETLARVGTDLLVNPKEIEPPKVKCGDCAYYKTPKCTFENVAGYIKKKDYRCADFYPDRHIARDKLRKRKIVQKRVE